VTPVRISLLREKAIGVIAELLHEPVPFDSAAAAGAVRAIKSGSYGSAYVRILGESARPRGGSRCMRPAPRDGNTFGQLLAAIVLRTEASNFHLLPTFSFPTERAGPQERDRISFGSLEYPVPKGCSKVPAGC